MSSYKYELAFCRNLGWITEAEFEKLRSYIIAIPGLGGVGGQHLISLLRMGFCRFHIADFDHFELPNFNRQEGATIQTLGVSKSEVMRARALQINPHAEIQIFSDGITPDNVKTFLTKVDLVVDGLDVTALKIRKLLFDQAYVQNIPCVTAAPIGFGASVTCFLPELVSFEEYFELDNLSEKEQILKFIFRMNPSFMAYKYLVDPKYFNPKTQQMPSTPVGCLLASSLAVTEVIKILLHRPGVITAPTALHFDAYLGRFKKYGRILGINNPWSKLKFFLIKRRILGTEQ